MKNQEPMKMVVEKGSAIVSQEYLKAREAEHDVEELQRKLMEIQLVKQQEEAADQKGKETERQIEAVAER